MINFVLSFYDYAEPMRSEQILAAIFNLQNMLYSMQKELDLLHEAVRDNSPVSKTKKRSHAQANKEHLEALQHSQAAAYHASSMMSAKIGSDKYREHKKQVVYHTDCLKQHLQIM